VAFLSFTGYTVNRAIKYLGVMTVDKMHSLKVRLSDIQKQRQAHQWTSDNVVVKEEAGDAFYKNESGRKEYLQGEFAKYESAMKELQAKVTAEGIRPLIYDANGQVVERGIEPNFTQESISVMKGASGNSKGMKALEQLGEEITPVETGDIKEAMKLKQEIIDAKGKTATIGTFNIEWLGTKKRKEEDYKKIAQVIKDTGAQILGIQEVSDEKALKIVMKNLPDYGYILGKSGGQRVGVIFDKKRVEYDINSIDQIDEAQVGSRLRAPLLVDMKIDGAFDFTFVVTHLKAMFDDKAIATRTEQAKKINKWITQHLEESKDKDLIMVGDFNDFVGSDSLKPLGKGGNVHFLTEGLPKSFYSNIPYKGLIDHCTVTNVDTGAMEEVIPGSIHTINEKDYPGYLQSISDHKPVVFVVRSDQDKD